jgi:hypothetical protein
MESVPEDWSREVSWITEVTEKIRKKVEFPVNTLFED